MYENTFFRKVYWTGSWSTSLVLRLWNAATMRLWNAAKCARNSLEMLASPGGYHFVCSKSVLKLCQSYSPAALLYKSLSVFKNRQKNRVENNRKIASRRIFDFFFQTALAMVFLYDFSFFLHHLSNCITYSYARVWAWDGYLCAGESSAACHFNASFIVSLCFTSHSFFSLHPVLSATSPPERPLRPCNCCLSDANERSYNQIAAGVEKNYRDQVVYSIHF